MNWMQKSPFPEYSWIQVAKDSLFFSFHFLSFAFSSRPCVLIPWERTNVPMSECKTRFLDYFQYRHETRHTRSRRRTYHFVVVFGSRFSKATDAITLVSVLQTWYVCTVQTLSTACTTARAKYIFCEHVTAMTNIFPDVLNSSVVLPVQDKRNAVL